MLHNSDYIVIFISYSFPSTIKKKLIVTKKEVNPGRNELPSKLSNFSNGRLENKTLK